MDKMEIKTILDVVERQSGAAFFYSPAIYKNECSYLFQNPTGSKTIFTEEDIKEVFNNTSGVYGYLNYEAGYLLEKTLTPLIKNNQSPLGKFFLNGEVFKFAAGKILFNNITGEELKKHKIKKIRLNVPEEKFNSDIQKIKKQIAAGNTYQVNYTLKTFFDFEGDPKSLFLSLIFNQSAKYIAFINDGDRIIISVSPELFFKKENDTLTTNPMKGTVKRGVMPPDDELSLNYLRSSIKEKAENVMIVDLLRNDMGKISRYGSVKVESLFNIEKYESVFQMTSLIKSKLNSGTDLFTIFKNLFPCGSVTGAPKISTMEIIQKLESEPRNVYTGAVGFSLKNKAVFNVPIRTVVIKDGKSEMGLGSGIVWDSAALKEYKEVKLKSNFITKPFPYFKIFTTILIENGTPFLIEKHLLRMKNSAGNFLFVYDEKNILSIMNTAISTLDKGSSWKLRIALDKWGSIEIQTSETSNIKKKFRITISNKKIDVRNRFQYHKTTNRKLYDTELLKAVKSGFDEIIFFNKKGFLAEGSFTNIFIKKNEKWYTPSLSAGVLNGVYREFFIENNNCEEKDITYEELMNADKVMLTNALRKEISVVEIII